MYPRGGLGTHICSCFHCGWLFFSRRLEEVRCPRCGVALRPWRNFLLEAMAGGEGVPGTSPAPCFLALLLISLVASRPGLFWVAAAVVGSLVAAFWSGIWVGA